MFSAFTCLGALLIEILRLDILAVRAAMAAMAAMSEANSERCCVYELGRQSRRERNGV
jgi:hypothetical protein